MEEKVEGNNQTTPETESKTGNEVIKPAGELANAMSQQNCKFQVATGNNSGPTITSFASPEDDAGGNGVNDQTLLEVQKFPNLSPVEAPQRTDGPYCKNPPKIRLKNRKIESPY